MCRTLLLLQSTQLASSLSPQLQRKLLRKLYKDLQRHSGPQKRGISPLELLKITDLPGLLGNQLFEAFDLDNDGILGESDFITTLFHLFQGSEFDLFKVFFDIVDFNKKGFITSSDLRAILVSLPKICPLCSQAIARNWVLDEVLLDLFGENGAQSLESLWSRRLEIEDVRRDVVSAVVNSLPCVVSDVFGVDKRRICGENKAISWVPLSETVTNVSALKFENRTFFCVFQRNCILGYPSLNTEIPKILIHTKGLFASPVDDASFRLKNTVTEYLFTANCREIRDKWMEEIAKYRWFDDFYEAGEVIGTGGQATVYRAETRMTRQPAAVKIISKDELEVKCEGRIRQEIRILKVVSHTNVMQLYDVFETEERMYVVSEVLTAGTLYSHLEATQFHTPESFAKSVISDIATALLYLHSHGIIHRDIKLENIMLRKDKTGHLEAVLIDFGLSCFLGPEQYSTEPVGTLKYAAPEVLSRLPYGYKADCWSLGVILYILLVGRMPFYGKNDQEIALRTLKKPIHLTGESWEHVSPEAKAVVEGLLTRKAESRWDAQEVLSSKWLSDEAKQH